MRRSLQQIMLLTRWTLERAIRRPIAHASELIRLPGGIRVQPTERHGMAYPM